MTLRVVKPGILSSLQGLGRRGYARFGVNAGGAMDTAALRLINLLLGNYEGEAAIEMHFPAGGFVAESDCVAVVGGADFGAALNDAPIAMWHPFRVHAGDRIAFTGRHSGARTYLAVAGGFEVAEWLGSKSTNLAAGIGGLAGRALATDDILRVRENKRIVANGVVSRSVIPLYSRFPTIRVLEGPEFGLLSEAGRKILENSEFVISPESNRMGFRLAGEPVELESPHEMVSSPVGFGTIQLLPSGQLIMLMADHQTSGGYPRVATVVTHDLPVAGQLSAGDKIAFRMVRIAEAEDLVEDFEREVALLRVGCMYSVIQYQNRGTNRS